MNLLHPDDFNTSRDSGNDTLTAMESEDERDLTAAHAVLIANALRGNPNVEDAEAVHVSHRNASKEWYQVNVLYSEDTISPTTLSAMEEDNDINLRAPQVSDGRLVLMFGVPDVELNEAGQDGLGDLFG